MPTMCECSNREPMPADKDGLIFCKNCRNYIDYEQPAKEGGAV